MDPAEALMKIAAEQPEQARVIFDKLLALTTDPDKRAATELAREYFCNAEFRAAMTEHIYELTANA